jgi:thymidylate synthase
VVEHIFKPLAERTPDTQYKDRLRFILENGELLKETPQGPGALTCFGTVPPMVFDLSNGVPLITERKIGFWRKPVAEIIAFINGARLINDLEFFGCDFWGDYRGKGTKLGLEPDDLGPGSYGAAFHDFPKPDGTTLNQFAQVIAQIKSYANMRTHLVSPWIPFYTARGENRKVVVAPCHGWLHFRVMNGKLHMRMDQRSADMPIGVPSNMIQYATLLLMMCRVTGYKPGNYIHSFSDAHIYENQIEKVEKLILRESRPFPSMVMSPRVTDLFAFRSNDFDVLEYDPHPGMTIPYVP